jgi:hypothetical protein
MINTLYEAHTDTGVRVRLIEQGIASFAILYTDQSNLAAIAWRTSDFVAAKQAFTRAVEIAALGFTHPAWRKERLTDIPFHHQTISEINNGTTSTRTEHVRLPQDGHDRPARVGQDLYGVLDRHRSRADDARHPPPWR